MSLRFVACIAPGALEAQVVLLCRSIRRFGGAWREAPVTVFGDCSAGVAAQLAALDAERRPHGERFAPLPMANKLFAATAAEADYDEDVLAIVDSDSLVVAEPAALALAPTTVAAVRPVNTTDVATTGPGHRMDGYWQAAYRLRGVAPPPFVPKTVGGERIRAFWNSGLVALRREAGLAAAWREDFLALIAARHLPPGGLLNQMEQVALSVALARVPDGVAVLDGRYNYPLPLRARLGSPWSTLALGELVHVHYFRMLHARGALEALPDDAVARWLSPHLPLAPESHAAAPRRAYRLPAAGGGEP